MALVNSDQSSGGIPRAVCNDSCPLAGSPFHREYSGNRAPRSKCPLCHVDPSGPCTQHPHPRDEGESRADGSAPKVRPLSASASSLAAKGSPSPTPCHPAHLLEHHKLVLGSSALVDFIFIPVTQTRFSPGLPMMCLLRYWTFLALRKP